MSEIEKGDVVIATAGREMGEYFLVTGVDDKYLSLVDGKGRTMTSPKRKKVTHVLKVSTGNKQEFKTDADVRKFLKQISKGD